MRNQLAQLQDERSQYKNYIARKEANSDLPKKLKAVETELSKLREQLIQIPGNDALTGFTDPKILWIKNNEPQIYAQIRQILLPKKYERFKMTVYILDRVLRGDGLKVAVFRQKRERGGGWIDSPLGAYVPDPSLTGKATFGFVSKYKKGKNTPDGNTEFQFRAADMNFHSTSYDWLVVSRGGSNAQFKGSGTINGSGDYRFMIWASD